MDSIQFPLRFDFANRALTGADPRLLFMVVKASTQVLLSAGVVSRETLPLTGRGWGWCCYGKGFSETVTRSHFSRMKQSFEKESNGRVSASIVHSIAVSRETAQHSFLN